MRKKIVVHSQFEALKYEIEETLHNFSEVGDDVIVGKRNHIKKVNIQGREYNIKRFKKSNLAQRLVYGFIRRSKARRSFEYANFLLESGIDTPQPIAYYEQFGFGLVDSYYICYHVEYDFDFRVLIHQPRFEDRESILRQFTAFTLKMHENRINFLDHSPGNTLINVLENGKYHFQLIDLNRMQFEFMSFTKRMHNFRRLWLSKTMVRIIADEYAKLTGLDYTKVHDTMLYYSRGFQKEVNSRKIRRKKFRKYFSS